VSVVIIAIIAAALGFCVGYSLSPLPEDED